MTRSSASGRPEPAAYATPAHEPSTGRALLGRRALVTGASRGIGRAIAVAFAAAGADLTVTARDEDGLARTADAITGHRRRAVVLPADLEEEDAPKRVIGHAADRLGGLDIVVNNAAWAVATPFEGLDPKLWRRSLRLNLEVPAQLCRAALPHLEDSDAGCVINIGSVAAFQAFPTTPHYAAGKAGLVSLTRTLAVEWAPQGIRVNALCPGYTRTEMTEPWWSDSDASEQITSAIPQARWAEPAEIAGPAVFLASAAASYITGQVLIVDGGLLTSA
ncbi:SDR family NAD(P)-dependent oxidoreductase [Actinomadura rubrisoli]|uniref:SDR family oxidoreductase n=1 Tax=Actinomadura rubrisoli TaxID=2530368 RepID=A0A4R5BBS2_9ACTN|nr:SDR family oxidoreductase [Actinomadura rubrisoli]TDD82683.1 SDR family oxidoreductase [Actinomadura rubrisoli]